MRKILLTDAQQRKTLSVMRSLGRRGEKPDCCDPFSGCLSRFSKYCSKYHRSPDPSIHPKEYLDFLIAYARTNDETVLYPMDDAVMDIVQENREILDDKFRYVIPPKDSYYILRYKDMAAKRAAEKGITCPRSYDLKGEINEIRFPVIIKPLRSSGGRGIKIVNGPEDLKEAYNNEEKFMVQEIIDISSRIDVCLIYNNQSELKASFIQRELRNFPDMTGPSTIQESICHKEAEELAKRYMEGLSWQGVAEIEFAEEKGSGRLIFMEANPRFWSSIELAVIAGIDFPKIYMDIAVCKDCDLVQNYTTGIRTKWSFPGELLAFFEAKKKMGADPSFFCDREHKTTDDTLRWNDPLPVIGLIAESIYYLLNRDRRKYIFRK